jgi:hypothetical protein
MFSRRSASDSAIGWISTVDSLLLGFGLMVVLALHSAMTQQNVQVAAKADKKELGEAKNDLKALQNQMLQGKKQVDGMKELLAESDMRVKSLTADLMDMSKRRDELDEHAQRLKEQLDAESQGVEGISQQLGDAIRERDSLRKQQAESDRQLAIAKSEIEGAKKQLADADTTATANQEERNTLESRVSEMQAMLLTLRDRQRQTTMQSDELKHEADRLKTAFDEKTRDINALREALAAKEREVSKIKEDHAEAKNLLQKALADTGQLKSRVDDSNRKLMAVQKEKTAAEKEQQLLGKANSDLQKKVTDAQAAVQRGKQLQGQLDAKSKELDRLRGRLKETEDAMAAAVANVQREARARGQAAATDVLGFKGQFRNVVFVIDISHSMTHVSDPERPGYENDKYNPARWNKTKREILSWVRNLPMESLRLVLFHSEVFEFPESGGAYSMKGRDRDESVRAIEVVLKDNEPTGQTNTLGALRQAYKYQGTDTMVLFTDGYPVVDGRKTSDLIASVRGLVRQHRQIPVNVVGIGEYFERSFADFLRDIASTTGGEFIGR